MPFTPGRPVADAEAALFKAMAHPGRIRVLELLIDRDHTMGELAAALMVEPSHLSHQVAALRRAGLVTSSRTGSVVNCSLGDPQIAYLLRVARDLLANHLRNTRDLLADLEQIDKIDDALKTVEPKAERGGTRGGNRSNASLSLPSATTLQPTRQRPHI